MNSMKLCQAAVCALGVGVLVAPVVGQSSGLAPDPEIWSQAWGLDDTREYRIELGAELLGQRQVSVIDEATGVVVGAGSYAEHSFYPAPDWYQREFEDGLAQVGASGSILAGDVSGWIMTSSGSFPVFGHVDFTEINGDTDTTLFVFDVAADLGEAKAMSLKMVGHLYEEQFRRDAEDGFVDPASAQSVQGWVGATIPIVADSAGAVTMLAWPPADPAVQPPSGEHNCLLDYAQTVNDCNATYQERMDYIGSREWHRNFREECWRAGGGPTAILRCQGRWSQQLSRERADALTGRTICLSGALAIYLQCSLMSGG